MPDEPILGGRCRTAGCFLPAGHAGEHGPPINDPLASGKAAPVSEADVHDGVLAVTGLLLAEAVRRFLARMSTQRVIDAGLLDDDVVRDLIEASDRMWLVRVQRLQAARRSDG
jgi:hypothetical protein